MRDNPTFNDVDFPVSVVPHESEIYRTFPRLVYNDRTAVGGNYEEQRHESSTPDRRSYYVPSPSGNPLLVVSLFSVTRVCSPRLKLLQRKRPGQRKQTVVGARYGTYLSFVFVDPVCMRTSGLNPQQWIDPLCVICTEVARTNFRSFIVKQAAPDKMQVRHSMICLSWLILMMHILTTFGCKIHMPSPYHVAIKHLNFCGARQDMPVLRIISHDIWNSIVYINLLSFCIIIGDALPHTNCNHMVATWTVPTPPLTCLS